jgi:hypothetical protein
MAPLRAPPPNAVARSALASATSPAAPAPTVGLATADRTDVSGRPAVERSKTGKLPQLGYEAPGWTTPDLDGDRYPDAADLATLTDVQLAVGYQVLAFSQIRMGFGPSRMGDLHPEFGLEYVVADVEATSLQAAIAGDAYLPWKTPLPLDRWLKFDLHFQLAPYCVRQGFNVAGMLRVGIVSSADPDCTKNAATSFIGFGARGPVFAGNVCTAGCAATGDIPAYSVLMVR